MRRFLVIGGRSGIGEACVDFIESRLTRRDDVVVPSESELDVTSFAMVNGYLKELQPTHILYSAGVNYLEWIGKLDYAEIAHLFDVNVQGFIRVIDAMWRHNSEMRGVSTVAITSDAAWRPMRTSIGYCASKAALEMAIRVASRELAPSGWRVNGVAPGKVSNTRMTDYVDARVQEIRGWTAEYAEEYERASSAIGRPVAPIEVAEVVWSVLTGPNAMTGEIVAVNGGR